MSTLTLTLSLLLYFGACSALRCPNEERSFYYADVSTGCQMYHFCENSELKTMNCPPGQAFDSRTSKCENASTVTCYEMNPFTAFKTKEHVRAKRQVRASDALYQAASPVVKPMVNMMAATILGSNNTLSHKVILPIAYEMLDNPASRRDVFSLFLSAKYAFAPAILDMFRYQIFSAPAGTVQIPREVIHKTVFRFLFQTKPILLRLVKRHFNSAFKRVVENMPLVIHTVIRLKVAKIPYIIPLKMAVVRFAMKHGSLLRSSTATHLNFYSMPEIIQDIMPIKRLLFDIMIEYLRQNPHSIVNVFYGELNLVRRQVSGMFGPSARAALH